MKLIDKDKIAAEIEKRYDYWREKEFNSHSIESEIRMSECQHLMLLFNTLEVKEVDLEKECDNWHLNHFLGRIGREASGDYLERSSQLDLAKHFFELGLKAAQKGK